MNHKNVNKPCVSVCVCLIICNKLLCCNYKLRHVFLVFFFFLVSVFNLWSFCLLTESIAIKLDKWDHTAIPFSSHRAPNEKKKGLILLLGGTACAGVNAFLSWWQVLSRPKRAQAFRAWP